MLDVESEMSVISYRKICFVHFHENYIEFHFMDVLLK